jgi:regulatory protein
MDIDVETLNRAKQQAYRLLAYKNRTAHELRDRLRERGLAAPVIDEVVRQLEAQGYIDDRRLALDWARYRVQTKPVGRRRLAWELQQRGLDAALVDEVIREVYAEVDESSLLQQALHKRLRGRGAAPSAQERQRLRRYLARQGFDIEVIDAALRGVEPSDDSLDFPPSDFPA